MADKFTIKFDAQMEIGQLKTAISQIQQEFKKIQIPQNATKPLTNTLEQLSKEIENFEKLTSKNVGSKADFGKIEKSSQHLLELWQKLNNSYNNLAQLSDNKLKKLFPEEISNNIKKAVTALKDYEKQTGEIDDNIKKIENSLKKAQEAQEKLTKDIEKENSKKIVDTEGFNNFKKEIQSTEKELSEYKKKLEEINNFIAEKNATLPYPKKSNHYRDAVKQAKELSETIVEVQGKLDNLYNDSTNITTKEQHVKELAKINEKYQETSVEVQEFSKQLKEAEKSGIDNSNKAFNTLAETLKKLLGLDISTLGTDSKEVGKAIEQYITNKVNQMRQSVDNAKSPIQNFGQVVQEAANKTHALGEEVRDFDQRAKEIDAIKSRITAFFGLNNAIMLARRALRSAYETVKELDKAMTETAVVTNFNVGDMWSQLPEYTKRANALGVTTLEAYQASTLFYQQGLKTNEVVALSNETLKMARIAGLDAAEATDRMTNALRGFNMTLTETNAQRIDDVYSKLAAITASNVDEISTAMTKVASLAHNANMEFETTSAFLAQIIETTRESAETAGTALKTVVARFSEVKDLYTKEELTGTDEEGEVIDVNKISKALRTAGIDLNRYFLGAVGLDDIFMELAEKWNSLTNVQQRYIATQAAGSRQQSRFIALMSDYARTQELVGAAYNANGAAAEQFEKTQDSLQSKLARLKNAWDEFTMGLANSTLIKTGVDLLTGVLKVVNQLTSGFGLLNGNIGSFIGALLKIGTVAGVRSLAKGPTAVLINSLGSVIGKGGITGKEAYLRSVFNNNSGQIGALQDAGWGQIFKQQFTGIFKNIKDRRTNRAENLDIMFGAGKPAESLDVGLFGNLGLKMSRTGFSQAFAKTKLGSGMASGLGKLLGFGAGEGGVAAASGVAALGAALIGVAAAGTAAYGVIKMLYDASPKGQIKYAEQIKNEIDHTKSSLEATKKTLDETLDSYNQQLDSLSKLEEGTIEWANAFVEVNKTVSDLIERFPKLAAYVTTTSNGLLQLDQKGLAQYQKELNEQIGKYSALSIMATGGVAQRKAMASQGVEATGQQYLAEASFAAAAKSLTKGEYTDEIYKAFAQNFDFNKWAKEAGKSAGSGTGGFLGIGSNIFKSKNALRQEYKELTGQEADANWNANQLADAIGQYNNTEKIEEYLSNISDLVSSIESKQSKNEEGSENSETFKNVLAGIFDQNASDIANDLVGQYATGLSDFELSKIAQGDFGFSSTTTEISQQIFDGFLELIDKMQQSTDMTPEEFAQAIQEHYNVDTLVAAGLALYQDIINNTEKFNVAKDITNRAVNDSLGIVGAQKFNEFMDKVGQVSNETYSKLGEVFTELSLNGVNVAETFKNLTPEAAEFLAQLDISDPDVIRMVINQLDSMGVEIDNEVIDRLINLADASTAAAEALEDINKSASLFKTANELKDRESYVFSGEEYNQLKEYDEEGFYQISDDLYIYIRDGFDKLIDGLNNKGITNNQNTIEGLQGNIKIGEEIEKVVLEALNSKSPLASLGREEIEKRIQSRFSSEEWSNYENLSQYRKILSQIGNSRAFYGSTKDLNNKTDIAAVFNSKSSKELLNYYNQANDSLKAQVKNVQELVTSEEERSAIAQKTALQYSEAIEQYSQLLSVISENKDLLLTEDKDSQFYQNAVQNVAQEIEQLYGLSHDAAVKFVEEHEKAIVEATESEKGFKNFLAKVAETWKNENSDLIQSTADAMGVSVSTINDMLTEIANSIKDLPDGEIGFNVKTDEALQQLKAYGFQVEDFMKSMGFELIAQPGSQIEIPNPGYAAMANIPAPDGGNLADKARIPRTNTVTSTRFIWKRIGSADTGGVIPPKTSSGSSSAPSESPEITAKRSELSREKQILSTMEAEERPEEELQEQRDKIIEVIQELIDLLRNEEGIIVEDPNNPNYELDTEEILSLFVDKLSYAAKEEEGLDLSGQISREKAYLSLMQHQGASTEELNEQRRTIQDLLHQQAETLRAALPEGSEDTEEIINLSNQWWEIEEDILASMEEIKNIWENLDRYYNINGLLDKLVQEENELNQNFQQSLKESSPKDIYKNAVALLGNYSQQYEANLQKKTMLQSESQALINAEKYADIFARGLIEVLEDGRLEFNWEAIDELTGTEEELYELVNEFTSKYDNTRNALSQVNSTIRSINSNIKNLKSAYSDFRNAYINLEKKVTDALVENEREIIESEKEYYQKLNENNNDILDAMQEQISLQRQIRDNTETEKEIRELESKLAYLRRDTTGANAQEILKLEQQIEEKRENYQDKLVDQELARLQKENKEEEKANNERIDELTRRLDDMVETGRFNNEATRIISNSIDENGELISNSALEEIMKEAANWDSMTAAQKEAFMEDLQEQVRQSAAYLYKDSDSFFTKLIGEEGLEKFFGSETVFGSFLQNNQGISFSEFLEKYDDIIDAINGIEFSTTSLSTFEEEEDNKNTDNGSKEWQKIPMTYDYVQSLHEGWDEAEKRGYSEAEFLREKLMDLNPNLTSVGANHYLQELSKHYKIEGFEIGGLNTKTGPAWLDGTPSRPEYVLNAEQTQAFLRLAEVLPFIMRGNTTNSVDSVKNIYLNLTMNVDEIADDYDVDQIADRVKEILYDAGTYRNVNMLSLN